MKDGFGSGQKPILFIRPFENGRYILLFINPSVSSFKKGELKRFGHGNTSYISISISGYQRIRLSGEQDFLTALVWAI